MQQHKQGVHRHTAIAGRTACPQSLQLQAHPSPRLASLWHCNHKPKRPPSSNLLLPALFVGHIQQQISQGQMPHTVSPMTQHACGDKSHGPQCRANHLWHTHTQANDHSGTRPLTPPITCTLVAHITLRTPRMLTRPLRLSNKFTPSLTHSITQSLTERFSHSVTHALACPPKKQ